MRLRRSHNASLLTLLVIAVVALAFVACGGDDTTTTVIEEQTTPETITETQETVTKTKPAQKGDEGTAPAARPKPDETTEAVPDVVDERLEVGVKEVKAAGYKPRFVGDGGFGVIVPRNWVICDQKPPGGSSAPRGTKVDLSVDSSC